MVVPLGSVIFFVVFQINCCCVAFFNWYRELAIIIIINYDSKSFASLGLILK